MNQMSEDLDFNVRRIAITVHASEVPFVAVPTNAGRRGAEIEGRLREAEFSTTDGLRMTFGYIEWPDGSSDVQPLDFISGADDYRRLERAGRMTFYPTGADRRASTLRAMKHGDREYPSLASVTWNVLDTLAGTDAAELLLSHGATRIGTYLALRPESRRFKDDPAVEVNGDGAEAAFAAFALTRIVPIMEGYGRANVEVLHS